MKKSRQQSTNIKARKRKARDQAKQAEANSARARREREREALRRRAPTLRDRQRAKGHAGVFDSLYGTGPTKLSTGLGMSMAAMEYMIATPAERIRDRIEREGGDVHAANLAVMAERQDRKLDTFVREYSGLGAAIDVTQAVQEITDTIRRDGMHVHREELIQQSDPASYTEGLLNFLGVPRSRPDDRSE